MMTANLSHIIGDVIVQCPLAMRGCFSNNDDDDLFYQSEEPLISLGCLSRIDESSLFLIVHIATFGRDICFMMIAMIIERMMEMINERKGDGENDCDDDLKRE